ncbi:hypothetical protein ABVT39_017773 [Epinephelus coioides]
MEPKPCHKVDQDVVRMMDEETLSKYIPHFGDRVFAKNWTDSASAEAGSNADKKKKRTEHIRAKMKLPSSGQATTSSSNHTCSELGLGNKNAARKTRKIELGWMNYQDGYFRQVRRPTGGGTREIIARKDDTVNKILGDGKKIFFPKGKSSKRRVKDSDFTLCVMGSEEPVDGTLTVGPLYDTTHHKILSSSSFMHAGVPSTFISNSAPASQTSKPSMAQTFNLSPDNEVIFLDDDGNITLDVLCDTLIYQPPHASEQQASDNIIEVQVDSNPASSTRDCRIIQQVIEIENPEPMTEVQSSNLVPTNGECDTSVDSQAAPLEVINQEASSNHTSTTSSSVNLYENPENIVEKQTIFICTVHCLSDMIEAFSDENILDANIGFRHVLENGELENGVGSGLVMDCLTDFWSNFYASRTSRTTYKIPTLHHAFQEREWKAVVRILVFGWQRFEYLPVQLAPPISS